MALYTQKAIMRTFQQMLEEMPFDKITVSALVRRCEISPNTFYYHYQDIYALLNVWFHMEFDQYMQLCVERLDWVSAAKAMTARRIPRRSTTFSIRFRVTSWSNTSSQARTTFSTISSACAPPAVRWRKRI